MYGTNFSTYLPKVTQGISSSAAKMEIIFQEIHIFQQKAGKADNHISFFL